MTEYKDILNIQTGSSYSSLEEDRIIIAKQSNYSNNTFDTQQQHPEHHSNNTSNIIPDTNHIESQRLKILKSIGEGNFGIVKRGTYQIDDNDPVSCAIKLHKNKKVESENLKKQNEEMAKETARLSKLKHKNIVQLYGYAYKDNSHMNLMMVMEYCAYGSLDKKLRNEKLPHVKLIDYAIQISEGMCYLVEQKVVHRDLACRNILLTDKAIKIADFGLSRFLEDKDYYRGSLQSKCPVLWTAPEFFDGGKFSSKSDVWSFGVVLWEMFSNGAIPWYEYKGDMKKVKELVCKERKTLDIPKNCPTRVCELMKNCWKYERCERPDFDAIRKDLEEIYAEFRANVDDNDEGTIRMVTKYDKYLKEETSKLNKFSPNYAEIISHYENAPGVAFKNNNEENADKNENLLKNRLQCTICPVEFYHFFYFNMFLIAC